MIPGKLKNLWPLIYAYLNGERVQCKFISTWKDITSISDFHAFNNEFRIYVQPKLVPFTFEDNLLFRDKWVKYKGKNELSRFTNILKTGVKNDLGSATYLQLLNNYEFEDGSPCGKYINE